MNTDEMRNATDFTQMKELLNLAADYIDAVRGPKYGCHCDLEPGMLPDECSLNTGDIADCRYAIKLSQEGKGPKDCKYWRLIQLDKLNS